MNINVDNVAEAVWTYSTRTLHNGGGGYTPNNAAQRIANAIWTYSTRTITSVAVEETENVSVRTEGSWGNVAIPDIVVGNTHYTNRDEASYAEIGQDTISGSKIISKRNDGSYGTYNQSDKVKARVVKSRRKRGSYGVAGQSDTVKGNVIISKRKKGSFGTKGGFTS